jgi:hypothetical protein
LNLFFALLVDAQPQFEGSWIFWFRVVVHAENEKYDIAYISIIDILPFAPYRLGKTKYIYQSNYLSTHND